MSYMKVDPRDALHAAKLELDRFMDMAPYLDRIQTCLQENRDYLPEAVIGRHVMRIAADLIEELVRQRREKGGAR